MRLYIAFFVLLLGCTARPKEEVIPTLDDLKHFPSELNKHLSKIREKEQYFSIDGLSDTTIIAKNGTQLFIPTNAFEFEDGTQVTDNVKIEIIEALSPSDIILNNLQTKSGDRILQTDGMIFVDATSANRKIKIRKDVSLTASIPTKKYNPAMKYFQGELTKDGVNWKTPVNLENENIENYLTALPFEGLNLKEINFECDFTQGQIFRLEKKEFAFTYIATREFKERLDKLAVITGSNCGDGDFLPNHPEEEVLKIYISNSNGGLSDADRKVNVYLKKYFKTHKVSEQFYVDYIASLLESFDKYSKLELHRPINYLKYGLKEPITLDKIDQLTIPSNEKNVLKMKFIETLQWEKYSNINKEVYSILSINEFGWGNVDKFYEEGEKCDFSVTVNEGILDVKIVLVVPKFSIYLNGYVAGEKFLFTKPSFGYYEKLPVGEKAFIIATGLSQGETYFALKEITIPKTGNIRLEIQKTELEVIKQKLKVLDLRSSQ